MNALDRGALDRLATDRRLLVCVGPGGVGKTTLSAALALGAARAGRRVAVITIDPARRLADALGLDGLDDALRPVQGSLGPGAKPGGSLDAAMLDTKTSYDALITRITPDPAARARILDNRVYQSFSRTLARSHAYVAMERVHDVLETGAHDLIVLDTPPTRSALDILDAPDRLTRFLDERVLGAFVPEGAEPSSSGRARAWIKARGTEVALKLFGAMAGDALMGELAGFFEVFISLRQGFAERASAVQAALRAEDTSFVLVTAPRRTHLADAAYLRDGLLERGAPIDAVLFNRAFEPDALGRPLPSAAPSWSFDTSEPGLPAGLAEVLEAARAERASVERADARRRESARAFSAAAPARHVASFPILEEEPASLSALLELLDAAVAEPRVEAPG